MTRTQTQTDYRLAAKTCEIDPFWALALNFDSTSTRPISLLLAQSRALPPLTRPVLLFDTRYTLH